MVFERITLLNIYDALKQIETNERRVSSILINRSSKFGTKTIPRFNNIAELRKFIVDNYPYRKLDNPECECYTCNEGVMTLLNFTIDDDGDKIFVNNLRREFESAKSKKINDSSIKTLTSLFKQQSQIFDLFNKYVCYSYISPQPTYWNPCEYVEFLTNKAYEDLINKYYTKTKRPDFPGIKKINC